MFKKFLDTWLQASAYFYHAGAIGGSAFWRVTLLCMTKKFMNT